MKYFLAFIMMFFIGIVAFSIDVSAISYTVTKDESVKDTAAETIMNQYLTSDYSPYYIYFKYQYPAVGTANGAYGFLKIYYRDDTTVTIPYNDSFRLSSQNPITDVIYGNVINLRAGGYRIDGYSNSWIRSQNALLSYNGVCNITIIENTVPIRYQNEEFEPPPTIQGDTFFVTKDNFTMNFGVFAGPGSEYVTEGTPNNFYRTKKYTVKVEFTYNNSTVSYTIPNYLNWAYKYNTIVQTEEVDNVIDYVPKFTFYAEPFYNSTMQAIRVPVIKEPMLSNASITDFNAMTDYRSFNQITFAQLKGALSTDYPDITINDLYTQLHFKFYDENNQLCYDGVNDFSSLYNSGTEPPDDPYVTNLTQTTELLNQYITSNNRYLKEIMYGDTYVPAPYEKTAKDAGNINLDLISVPDYTYQHQQLDSGATTFFGRMVEWWYLDTPFGIIAIVALTFLVIRTIIW